MVAFTYLMFIALDSVKEQVRTFKELYVDQEISLLFCSLLSVKTHYRPLHWFSLFVLKGLIRFPNKIFLFRNERPTHCVGGGGALGGGMFHLVCCFPTSNIS